jgi:glycosyltransferase involved in cell wall biosynthesis
LSGTPHLLLLAYYYPPSTAIGAVRTDNMARQLALRGWRVTVVTPEAQVWRVPQPTFRHLVPGLSVTETSHHLRLLSPVYLRTPDTTLTRFAGGLLRRTAAAIDVEPEIGWMRGATTAARNVLKTGVDVVLASGSPFGSFDVAATTAREAGVPYVLDYRDLWSGNPCRRAISGRQKRREAGLVSGAAAVFVVSDSLGQALRAMFGADRIEVVTNGFDPEEMKAVRPRVYDHPAIVYAGTFYPPRDAEPIMRALAVLRARNGIASWRFHYFGPDEAHVRDAAQRCAVQDLVLFHGNVPRSQALEAIAGARLSVVMTTAASVASLEEQGIVTGKIFEAIGCSVPVLAVAPAGTDIERVVARAGAGVAISAADTEDLADALHAVVSGNRPHFQGRDGFAWPLIGERVDEVLRSVIRRSAA